MTVKVSSKIFFAVVLVILLPSPHPVVMAFVPIRKYNGIQRSDNYFSETTGSCPNRMISLRIATQSSQNLFEDILEDDKGHINPELAQMIWKWEKQQRLNLDLPDFQNSSTRDGLRWVKELVNEKLQRTTATDSATGTSNKRAERLSRRNSPPPLNSDDLFQEAVFALMQALKTFERQSRPSESFEQYAKANIKRALDEYTLERAKGTGLGGTTLRHRKPPLSMESTVEIADPLEAENQYLNQDEWENREGVRLGSGRSVNRDESVEEFMDETMQYEGEDQMWIHEQSVAAPLRDMIPESVGDEESSTWDNTLENSSSLDDLALTDMILYNVDDFLDSTLDDIEAQVIQMRFGLDDGNPKTQKEIASELSLSVSQVRTHQKRALEKLRASFTDRYLSIGTNDEKYGEDTV